MLKINKLNAFSRSLIRGCAAFGTGFILADSSMAGISSFADISLAGASELPDCAALLTGEIIRCTISGTIGDNIVKITAIVLIVIIRLFYENVPEPKKCGLITALSIFISGAAVSTIIGEFSYKAAFYGFYGAMSGYTAYSTAIAFSGLKKRSIIDLTDISGCACAVAYTVYISSLCSVKISVINIGIILGSCVTLLAAYYYGREGGVICGSLTACGAFLASEETGMTVVLLPAAGLLTGFFHRKRISFTAAFFLLLSFFLMILTGMPAERLFSFGSIFTGTLLFMVSAPHFRDKQVTTGNEFSKELLGYRLMILSEAVRTLQQYSARKTVPKYEESSIINDTDIIRNKVCERCYRNNICWHNEAERTGRIFRNMSEMAEISKECFPSELVFCLRKSELCSAFRQSAREKIARHIMNLNIHDNTEMLAQQFGAASGIVRKAAAIKADERWSKPLSIQIMNKLCRRGLKPEFVSAYYNSYNRLCAEIYFLSENSVKSSVRICDLIADELGLEMESEEPANTGYLTRIRICECPRYKINVCGASMRAETDQENGDTSAVFCDGTGNAYIILSDGMGSGNNAAEESRTLVRIMKHLIACGMDIPEAVRLANIVLSANSSEENFATLDLIKIDLDNCRAEIYKAGAAPTIVMSEKNIRKISSSSFPVGIVNDPELFSYTIDLSVDDTIIIFSDGINENELPFVKECLLRNDRLQSIVQDITAKSVLFSSSDRLDDVTVLGLRIQKN